MFWFLLLFSKLWGKTDAPGSHAMLTLRFCFPSGPHLGAPGFTCVMFEEKRLNWNEGRFEPARSKLRSWLHFATRRCDLRQVTALLWAKVLFICRSEVKSMHVKWHYTEWGEVSATWWEPSKWRTVPLAYWWLVTALSPCNYRESLHVKQVISTPSSACVCSRWW